MCSIGDTRSTWCVSLVKQLTGQLENFCILSKQTKREPYNPLWRIWCGHLSNRQHIQLHWSYRTIGLLELSSIIDNMPSWLIKSCKEPQLSGPSSSTHFKLWIGISSIIKRWQSVKKKKENQSYKKYNIQRLAMSAIQGGDSLLGPPGPPIPHYTNDYKSRTRQSKCLNTQDPGVPHMITCRAKFQDCTNRTDSHHRR